MATIKTNIYSNTIEEFIEQAHLFHGYAAPGIILGGFMIDLAFKHVPNKGLFDVICETGKCLPDAIQLLTPCTVGNGWLKVFDVGRFALALYEKTGGEGIRVYVNPANLDKWPEIKSWFFKVKVKKDQDSQLLMEQIKEAGSSICGYRAIKIDLHLLVPSQRTNIVLCPRCKEAYPAALGEICPGCQGKLPYL